MNVDTDNPHMRQALLAGPGRLREAEEKTPPCTTPSVIIRDIHDSSSVPSTKI
jgi:hypothetical protein